MTTKANAEIQALTSALVHITNNHKIYGAKSAITKSFISPSDTSYIADILLQSLETIRTLQKERDDLSNEINEVEVMRCKADQGTLFIITQSERKKMINFIWKNLERPVYIPIHLDYGVWLNDKSVGKLRELVINACEIIEINCTSGSLAWQEAIEQFPKIFDDRGDVIVGEEFQLKA